MYKETIAAVATALAQSESVSSESAEIRRLLWRTGFLEQRIKRRILEHAESHTIHYGFIYDGRRTCG